MNIVFVRILEAGLVLVGVIVLYKVGRSIYVEKIRKSKNARLTTWEHDELPTYDKGFGYYASKSVIIIIAVLETLGWLVSKL